MGVPSELQEGQGEPLQSLVPVPASLKAPQQIVLVAESPEPGSPSFGLTQILIESG